jgi:hypothetical protein
MKAKQRPAQLEDLFDSVGDIVDSSEPRKPPVAHALRGQPEQPTASHEAALEPAAHAPQRGASGRQRRISELPIDPEGRLDVVVERGQLVRREQGEEQGETKRARVMGFRRNAHAAAAVTAPSRMAAETSAASVQKSSSSKTLSRALVSASAPGRMSGDGGQPRPGEDAWRDGEDLGREA